MLIFLLRSIILSEEMNLEMNESIVTHLLKNLSLFRRNNCKFAVLHIRLFDRMWANAATNFQRVSSFHGIHKIFVKNAVHTVNLKWKCTLQSHAPSFCGSAALYCGFCQSLRSNLFQSASVVFMWLVLNIFYEELE